VRQQLVLVGSEGMQSDTFLRTRVRNTALLHSVPIMFRQKQPSRGRTASLHSKAWNLGCTKRLRVVQIVPGLFGVHTCLPVDIYVTQRLIVTSVAAIDVSFSVYRLWMGKSYFSLCFLSLEHRTFWLRLCPNSKFGVR